MVDIPLLPIPEKHQPTKKVAAIVPSTGAAIAMVWLLKQFGVDMPSDVAIFFTGVLVFVVSYFVPASSSGE